jgi:chromate transport protein ChrA
VLLICQGLPGLNASNTAILVGDRLHSQLREEIATLRTPIPRKLASQLLTLYTTPVV